MANELLELSLRPLSSEGFSPTGFVDQVVFSRDFNNAAVYLSAYGYPSSLENIKFHKWQRCNSIEARIKTSEGYNKEFSIMAVSGRNSAADKCKNIHIPGSEYAHYVRYVDLDEFESDQTRRGDIIYMRLGPLLEHIRSLSPEITEKQLKHLFSDAESDLSFYLRTYKDIRKNIAAVIKNTSVPFLEEWIEYCLNRSNGGINLNPCNAHYSDLDNPDNIYAVVLYLNESSLQNTVARGLANKEIHIMGTNSISSKARSVRNLTEYLAEYSDQLIDKAGKKFVPRFNPNVDKFTGKELEYFEYAEYVGKMKFFSAQKNVIGAINRSLAHQKNIFLIGEMGVGKTAIATSAVYCHAEKKNTNTVVMCPGHLVNKWKKELLRLYPGARVEIISDFSQMPSLEKEARDSSRRYPLFMVLSKDVAKMTYQEIPAVSWDPVKQVFRCPKCGNTIGLSYPYNGYSETDRNTGKQYSAYEIHNAVLAFLDKKDTNGECRYIHQSSHAYIGRRVKARLNYSCRSSLWTTATAGSNSKWFKHPAVGYLHEDMLQPFKAYFENLTGSLKSNPMLNKIYKAVIDVEENGKPKTVTPRRYSIARFIRNHFKGLIDYFIADECHLYSTGSQQSDAFGDIARCSKHTLALTGTILNGYATGIHSLLFRLQSKAFLNRGYTYNFTSDFVSKYGVKKETFKDANGNTPARRSTKVMPGISPELFCDFLLENTVFLSLSDMANGLPGYKEIPLAVEMDDATKANYIKAAADVKTVLEHASRDTRYIAFMAAQKLALYPDQPFDMAPVHNKNGEAVVKFSDTTKDGDSFLSNKDLRCLELVQEKIAAGENVLIYVNYVNSTNCVDRLKKLFTLAGIKNCVLTANVKASEREHWIADKVKDGCRVLITNPSLVETGLDLLDFTNIVFYQCLSYNLHCMRQASRRSYRLNQPKDVTVYFMYFKDTASEAILSIMSQKLQAALCLEGKFSEDGLATALGNSDDILTQIADSLVKNIQYKVEEGSFITGVGRPEDYDGSRFELIKQLENRSNQKLPDLFDTKKRKARVSIDDIFRQFDIIETAI